MHHLAEQVNRRVNTGPDRRRIALHVFGRIFQLKVHGVQRLDDVVVQVLVAAIPIERGDQRAQLCGEARVVGFEPRA